MPLFEYSCDSCGTEFETLVRGSSPAPECPSCHGSRLQKKLSAFAAIMGATAARTELPGSCQSCGHPDGPGACEFS